MHQPPRSAEAPEYNVTGIDFADCRHFRYDGPIIDVHTHVLRTRPADPPQGPPLGEGPDASTEQAETMIRIAAEFGIVRTYSMCFADDIAPLRQILGDRIGFTGSIAKQKADDPDDAAYRLLDRFLAEGVEMIKFWAAPRGRERGLFLDAPWRIEAARRARAAGIRTFLVHVADPDIWFRTVYADAAKFGTKEEQYRPLERMLELFPEANWIAAHMGGDPEHPDHLQALLEKYPNLYFDTSATKWQVREVSKRPEAIRHLLCKHPDRFLFGSDLVTRHQLHADHYVSRYWCQRTLWESDWCGQSPIADPDHVHESEDSPSPLLRAVALPADVLRKVYFDNARRLLGPGLASA